MFARTLAITFTPFLLLACSADVADQDGETVEAADELNLSRTPQLGALAFGETKEIPAARRGDRALRIEAKAGDVLDVWVRGATPGADTRASLVDATSRSLATNDDADATTADARVRATIERDGAYYLVFRDKRASGAALRVSLSTKLAGLPDGTYHIPTGKRSLGAACRPGTAVFRVEKRGDTFSVRPTQSEVTSSNLVGAGSVSSGTFKGDSSWGSEVYGGRAMPYPPNTSYYEMTGSLSFEGGSLSLAVAIKGGLSFVTTTTFSGRIGTTLFGQAALPAGFQRATLPLYALYGDRPSQLESIVVLRGPDGGQRFALPQYVGDVPTDDEATRAQNDCSPSPQITARGRTVSVSWRGKYVQASLPDAFVQP